MTDQERDEALRLPPMPDVGLGPQSRSFIQDWCDECVRLARQSAPQGEPAARDETQQERLFSGTDGLGPIAWLLPDNTVNHLQIASIKRLIDRARHAHYCNFYLRVNGKDEMFEADWVKHLVRTSPPAQAIPEGWPKLKQVEWADYDQGWNDALRACQDAIGV